MDDVFTKVREIIANSLFIDAADIQLHSNLTKDLGAESIDFLDIVFRLEQTFSIKLPKGEYERRARADLSDAEFAISGVLQPKGLERIIALMPGIDKNAVKSGLYLRDLPTLYTVETFVKMVEENLNEKARKSNKLEVANSRVSADAGQWAETQNV